MRTSEGKARLFWLGFAIVLLLALRAPAQTLSGSISGTVVDQSDAVVAKVSVTLTNESNGETRKTVTSESGEFVFIAVPSGTYTVAVEAPGFKGFRRTGVNLGAVERLPLGTIRLTVGDVTQSVVVASQGETVSAESADVVGASAGLGRCRANSLMRRRVTAGASSASPAAMTLTASKSRSAVTSLSRKPLAPARSAS